MPPLSSQRAAETPSPQTPGPEVPGLEPRGPQPRLVVATGNAHKVDEIRAILAEQLAGATGDDSSNGAAKALSLDELLAGIAAQSAFAVSEPVEDGVTFAANALIKARHAADATGLPALADDSGISVDVLGGSPGIFSARWAGVHGDDAGNRDLLLAQLADVPDQHRGARFVCAMALVAPAGHSLPGGARELVVQGEVVGTLTHETHGEGGFGYDPIFRPAGYQVTTAEMSSAEKNSLSHRAAALRQLAEPIVEVLEA